VGGGGSGGGTVQCYSETVTTASLDDLANGFMPGPDGNWLSTALAAVERRAPGTYKLLDTQKGDSQLPGYADPSSFDALMESLYTACSAESSEYDYASASVDRFEYFMPPAPTIQPKRINSFPKSEIAGELTDDSTSAYDGTYLQGQQGSWGFVELGDDLSSEINGLACITAVGDHLSGGISARDGTATQLYYLELYLRRARTAHPSVYAALKGDPDWQRFVRYAWARSHFWFAYSLPNANLGIDDARIWAHVHEALNRDEITKFTGEDSVAVACSP
jgi:hypothetical protein